LKKKKQRKTIKINLYLAFILVTDNCSTTKLKKKSIVVTKGLKAAVHPELMQTGPKKKKKKKSYQ
jgi:hypothetical protein